MTLRLLSLRHIRSYEFTSIELSPTVTLILGRNGSGKTTLLEALYYLHRGTSFRGRDRDMVRYDQVISDFKLEFADGSERRARLAAAGDKITKEFIVEDRKSARLPAKAKLPVVLFEPDELRLLTSSPQRRRQFIDGILGRLQPSYSTLLARYERTLAQRNELLKQREKHTPENWDSQLFAWDIRFAELARDIVTARHDFLKRSNERLGEIYSRLADASHRVSVTYSHDWSGDVLQQKLIHLLHTHRHDDALRGYTTHGPHRDDFVISLDGHPASETASRGELRTIMLAYKLLEVELQEMIAGSKPLILLDDVFSELDIIREKKLITELSGYQTVITATDLRDELLLNATQVKL